MTITFFNKLSSIIFVLTGMYIIKYHKWHYKQKGE